MVKLDMNLTNMDSKQILRCLDIELGKLSAQHSKYIDDEEHVVSVAALQSSHLNYIKDLRNNLSESMVQLKSQSIIDGDVDDIKLTSLSYTRTKAFEKEDINPAEPISSDKEDKPIHKCKECFVCKIIKKIKSLFDRRPESVCRKVI